jgi:hypothetical protein
MAGLITDDIVDAFAVVGSPEEIAPKLLGRYGDMVTRVSFYAPYRMDHERTKEMLAAFRAA